MKKNPPFFFFWGGGGGLAAVFSAIHHLECISISRFTASQQGFNYKEYSKFMHCYLFIIKNHLLLSQKLVPCSKVSR